MIKLDQAIEFPSKGKFPRIAVEFDLSRSLVPGVDIAVEDDEIPSFWQQFENERITYSIVNVVELVTDLYPAPSHPTNRLHHR